MVRYSKRITKSIICLSKLGRNIYIYMYVVRKEGSKEGCLVIVLLITNIMHQRPLKEKIKYF